MLDSSQAESTYSEASIAASAIRSIAALDASGVVARSSWLRRARRRCEVGVGVAGVDGVAGTALGLGMRLGFLEQ